MIWSFSKAGKTLRILGRSIKQCVHRPLLSVSVRSISSNSGLAMSITKDVAIINMKNGDNRLNADFFNTYHDYLDQIESNTSIKGLITTAEGKFFSNGLDLDWMGTLSSDQLIDFMKSFLFTVRRVLTFSVPTLAAINGHAFAGGAILGYAHDLRVMNEEKGWICLNEVHLNIRVYQFLSALVRAKAGNGNNVTNGLVFGGRFTGPEALQSGLINAQSTSANLLENSISLLKSYHGKKGFDRSSLQSVKEDAYIDCIKAYDESINDLRFSLQFMNDVQLKEFNNRS